MSSSVAVSGTRERILDATLRCAAELGLARLTLEEVAVRAEVSRQTVYRYFGRREALIAAVVVREEAILLDRVLEAVGDAASLQEAVERALVALYDEARAHPLLDRLLRDEPESILPYLVTGNAPVLAGAERVVKQLLADHAPGLAEERRDLLADMMTRLAISYVLDAPAPGIRAVAPHLADIMMLAAAT